MPVIEIDLSEDDLLKLQNDYQKMCALWSPLGQENTPPAFSQWLVTCAISANELHDEPPADDDVDHISIFNDIEKLVTSLYQHDFTLVHLTKPSQVSGEMGSSALELAQFITTDFKLPERYVKRIQDLLQHYLKNPKEVTDLAQIGLTNKAYSKLHASYRQLVQRTEIALPSLGAERATGRVEGAAAMLVGIQALDRNTAKDMTNAFKAQARARLKGTWVRKFFGNTEDASE